MKKRYIISFVVAIIILSVLFLWNVGAGSVDISTSDLFAILAGSGKDETFSQIVWKIRLPRILAAILLGGALSVSGFLLQSFSRIRLQDRMCLEFHPAQNWWWRLP